MTVRELVTKITFSLNKSSVSQADQAVDNTKKKMNEMGASAERAAANAASGMTRMGQAIYWAMSRLSSLGSAIARLRSALSGLNLSSVSAKFRQFGSAASDAIGRVRQATDSLAGRMAILGGAVAAAFSMSKIQETADAMMNLDGRLRTVTDTEQERYATEDKLYQLSQNNRQSLESMGDLYYKVARGAQQFGISEEDSMRVTDVVSKALTVGGASATEAKASILQLGQALGSGVLQGDELHSLDENASLLMKHIADHFGVTVGQLKDMGRQGMLTSEEVIRAILESGTAVDGEFSKMPMTIGQSLQKVENAWDNTIMQIQRKTNVFGRIANFISDQLAYVENEVNAFMDLASGPASNSGEDQSKYAALQQQHENLVAILDVWNAISGVIKDVEDFLGTDNMGAKIAIAAVAAGGLLTVLGLIGGVLSGVSALWGILSAVFSAGLGIISALSWPVVLAMAAIGSAIYFVQEHWNECVALFQPGLDAMMNGIELLKGAWYNIQPAIKALDPLLSAIATFIGGTIVFAIMTLWNTATAAFEAIAAVINGVAYALGVVAGWIDSLISKVQEFLGLQNQINGSVTNSWVSNWHNSRNQTQNNTYNFSSAGENVLGVYQNNNSFFDAGG